MSPYGTRFLPALALPALTLPALVLVALGGALLAPGACAQERSPGDPLADSDAGPFVELTPEVREAIADGVAWLAREQVPRSGRWPSRPALYEMSVTALAGLALLAHGETPERGPYSAQLRAALLWVLENQLQEGPHVGLLFDGRGRDPMDGDERSMHGHGLALLFLGEVYGQTRDPALRQQIHQALGDGVRLVERTISPDGGWFYYPGPAPRSILQDEGSVTVTQIQALRSAANAGIQVDAEVVRRANEYIKSSQDADGGVRYAKNWGRSSPALTAAGIAVLQGTGEYHSDAIERGYAYLRQHLTVHGDQRFFFYTHLYASQAMFQRGGASWAEYLPRIRRELLWMRKGYPYWESSFGRSYGTAIALLVLQMPLRYLPIQQR